MKKLLGIVVLGLLLSENAYSHDDPNHSYLKCSNAGGDYKYIEIDFKKKTLFDRYGQLYEIVSVDKLYLIAKRKDIILTINRYSGILFTKGRQINVMEGYCEALKKQF